MSKVYDTFSFFNELDLLEIRLNILDKYTDYFVIVESSFTFSGKKKPLYYDINKEKYSKWSNKIIHYIVDDYPNDKELCNLMDKSGLTGGMSYYSRAFYQKESIRKSLINADDNDICYFGDVDEIWKPKEIDDKVYKLKQIGYSYYLNNRSSEDWIGTIVTKCKNIRNGCLNEFRARPTNFLNDGGWHFTNLGGYESVINKIESYDHQEFNNDEIKSKVKQRIENNQDFLGRNSDYSGKKFNFWIDESDLPKFILENKEKYKKHFK